MSQINNLQASNCDRTGPGFERRTGKRSRLILRTARITTRKGKSIAVVIDVADGGLKIRTFFPLHPGDVVKIDLTETVSLEGEVAWCRGDKAGIRLFRQIDALGLLFHLCQDAQNPRHRSLRLDCNTVVTVRSEGWIARGSLRNISLRGARIELTRRLRPDQTIDIACGAMCVTSAVRWVEGKYVGVQFLQTLTLEALRSLLDQAPIALAS